MQRRSGDGGRDGAHAHDADLLLCNNKIRWQQLHGCGVVRAQRPGGDGNAVREDELLALDDVWV